MRFETLEFNEGINTTVRRGVKTYETQDTEFGNYVFGKERSELSENGSVGLMKVLSTKHFRFCDLTNSDLINQHDPQTKTVDGLTTAFSFFYDDFDEREIITIVEFEFTPWA